MAAASQRMALGLRLYRVATSVIAPLAGMLVARRLKRGNEHPDRLDERYGASTTPRPAGPLVWIHGASGGEILTDIALMEQIRGKDFGVLCTSGTVTSANLAQHRLPSGAIHQFITLDAPRFVN